MARHQTSFCVPGPPCEIREKIRSFGKTFNPEMGESLRDIYIPIHRDNPKEGVKIHMDISYGPDERHLLDIHEPVQKSGQPMPILAFFHGGGFVSGNKNTGGEYIYGNVASYFAGQGILGVNATYRLAPQHQWPEGSLDVGRVVSWLKENGKEYGGDPDRIYLFGHSAGAAHVATYAFHKELQPAYGPGIAGAILMSGLYNPEIEDNLGIIKPYYGQNRDEYKMRASINHIHESDVPVFIIFAEYDPHIIEVQSIDLLKALCGRDRRCPRVTRIRDHNHLSECYHIGTSDESIGPEIIDFIKSGK